MTHEHRSRPEPAWLELAVAGELGPVLRSALLRFATPRVSRRTVLRPATASDVDVLAVLEALATEGLDVTSVRQVPPEPTTDVRRRG
jgi:hypothetical protein